MSFAALALSPLVDNASLVKIFLAILIGFLIGGEREFRDKAAGVRTNIFICVGSTLFTMLSIRIAGYNDPGRIAANIVSGIGFLGAGVIMRDRGKVTGLTTASTIWVVAALGMGIGSGEIILSSLASLVILTVLLIFPVFDKVLGNFRQTRNYSITFTLEDQEALQVVDILKKSELFIKNFSQQRNDGKVICSWEAYGSPKKQQSLSEKLFVDTRILHFNMQ
jgi:putative Mg2+ transporter-C (MgtC) family protein